MQRSEGGMASSIWLLPVRPAWSDGHARSGAEGGAGHEIETRPVSHRRLGWLLLPVLLGSGGCVTAGLAAMGPVMGSIAAIGDRTVERTIPADLSTTWGATVDALARMAVRVDQTEKSGDRWRLTGTYEGITVHGTLERVTASMTRVSIRVEAGRLYADKRTAEELLNQIGTSLASLTNPGSREAKADASAGRLEALRQAIERLGAKVDKREDGRELAQPGRPDDGPASPPALMTSPIIMVPASAGVATVPGPLPTLVQAPAVRPTEEEVEHVSSRPGVAEVRQDPTHDIMASPLRSVDVLRPVEGLTVRPASQ